MGRKWVNWWLNDEACVCKRKGETWTAHTHAICTCKGNRVVLSLAYKYIHHPPSKEDNLDPSKELHFIHKHNFLSVLSQIKKPNFVQSCVRVRNCLFMTRSSQHISANISEFDGDFERTLRRKRRHPEPSEPTSSSEAESEFEEKEEEVMAANNRTIKEHFDDGLSMEDLNKHLKEFEVVCSSMTPINVDGNILMMKAFPFSLLERAKDWLYELAPGTVTSWESMKRAFLEKFFPTSRVILLRKKISGIQQNQGESFPTYYERYKTLVASCPEHQMKEELLIQYFYEGLVPIERQMLDASVGGTLVDMTPVVIGSKPQENQVCTVCSIQGHPSEKCPQLIENGGWESANVIGFQGQNQTRYDPYSNTYNPGLRDHPNMKWREPQQPAQQRGFRQNPCGFPRPYQQNQPPPAQPRTSSPMDNDQLVQLLTNVAQGMQNQAKEVEDLKKQMGQMAEFMGQFSREQGKLPSSTNVNPKGGFESAKAIMLRSGKEVGSESDTHKSAQKEDEKLQNEEGSTSTPTEIVNQPLPQASIIPKSAKQGKLSSNSLNTNLTHVPFPRRFMQSKKDESEKDILETFRKVQVNIPLLEAIKQVPKYAKFLKELCTTKRRMSNKEVVKVSENVSAVLQRKLPTKCKDPGSFMIPCVIDNTRFENAMLDLGASINVMPYSIYASMNLGELKKDGVIIQLADRSNAYPKGVLEDVLV
ncbi:unnamed protein product [Malus baccata var. baccata]